MNYWITTDTHFGHSNLIQYSGRPENFEELIFERHAEVVKPDDVLIHLGDICIGNDAEWHKRFYFEVSGWKWWLVKGNHDKKSNTWYMNHGWDFVCETMSLNIYGFNVLFSHKPQKDTGYDINIHGHFHNSDHRRHEPDLVAVKNNKQILVVLEHHYTPYKLRTICEQAQRDKVRDGLPQNQGVQGAIPARGCIGGKNE